MGGGMITELPARCAVEVWSAYGERTRARLAMLVAFFAASMGRTDVDALQAQALAALPAWAQPTD